MSVFREYIGSLKMAEVEETLDLILYRPVAYLFVKAVHRTRITPNQVTLLSLISGWCAGAMYMEGIAASFVWAGLFLALANTLDCADGQLARMQKSGTSFGRLVDGFADYLISIVIFIGLGIGLSRVSGSSDVWFLVVAAGLSSAAQAITFDFIQQQYLSAVRGERPALLRELARVEGELSQPGIGSHAALRGAGLKLYLKYLTLQRGTLYKGARTAERTPDEYRRLYRGRMRLWTLLGSTTNRSLLILTSLLQYPLWYCWIVVVAGNLFLIGMLILNRERT